MYISHCVISLSLSLYIYIYIYMYICIYVYVYSVRHMVYATAPCLWGPPLRARRSTRCGDVCSCRLKYVLAVCREEMLVVLS